MEDKKKKFEGNEAIYPPRAFFRDNGMRMFGEEQDLEFKQLQGERRGQLNTPAISAYVPDEGGVLVMHEGDRLPVQQWAFKEGIICGDMVKRSALNTLKFLTNQPMRYITPLFIFLPRFLKRKIINSAVYNYVEFADCMFERIGAVLNEDFYCTAVRELHRTLTKVISHPMKNGMVDISCMTLEFDDAYRFVMQDAAGEVNIEALLKDPFKELQRVLRIVQKRGPGISAKIGQLAMIMPFMRFIPGAKEFTIAFFKEVNIEKMKLNRYDWYKCCRWGGYDFGGVSLRERSTVRQIFDSVTVLEKEVVGV